MKVTLREVRSFDITIGNHMFKGFTKRSEWNGMTELSNDTETIIIHSAPNPFMQIFSEIFQAEYEGHNCDVVAVSLGIQCALKEDQDIKK